MFLATQARDSAPHYQHSEIGYNYRLSNISAGIGRGQMEVLDKRVEGRREMFQFYVNLFQNINGIRVFKEPNSDFYSNHWLTVITIDEKLTDRISREDLRKFLETENIESSPLWKPMHMQPIFIQIHFTGRELQKKCLKMVYVCRVDLIFLNSDRDRIKRQF